MGICCLISDSFFRSVKQGIYMITNLQLLTKQWNFHPQTKNNQSLSRWARKASLVWMLGTWLVSGSIQTKQTQWDKAPEIILKNSITRIDTQSTKGSKWPATECGLRAVGTAETWTTAGQILPMSEYRIVSSVPALVRTCPLKEIQRKNRDSPTSI